MITVASPGVKSGSAPARWKPTKCNEMAESNRPTSSAPTALRSSDDGGRLDVEALLGLRGTNQVELLDERARAHVHVGGGSRERSVCGEIPPAAKEGLGNLVVRVSL